MPADEGISFLLYVHEQEEEALLFKRWINGYQMVMPFEEFKHDLTVNPLRDDKKTLEDVREIMTSWEAKDGNI